MLLKIYPLRAESGKFERLTNPGISCSFTAGTPRWSFNRFSYRFFLENLTMPAMAYALGVLTPQTEVPGYFFDSSAQVHRRRDTPPMWYQHARGFQVYRCKPHISEPQMLIGEAPYQFLP